MKRFNGSRAAVSAVGVACLFWLGGDRSAARAAAPVAIPTEAASLHFSLALRDTQPTPWDGRIELSQGRLLELLIQPKGAGKVQGGVWQLKTRLVKAQRERSVHDPELPPVNQPVLLATLDAPKAATVSVETKQGNFSFVLGDLQHGRPETFLDGQVRVELVPFSKRLTAGPDDEDLPAAAVAPDGTVWMAYTAYKHAQALDLKAIHSQKQFDTLKSEGHGDRIYLMKFDGSGWSEPIRVTEAGLDVWRPAVAVDGEGAVWVVWSQNVRGNWDLFARSRDPQSGKWAAKVQLTRAPGSDVNPAAVTDPTSGRVYVAWQGWRKGSFDVLLTSLDGARAAAEKPLAQSPANEWCPVAAFDSKGTLHVAFDTYEKGNYDVTLVSDAAGPQPRTIAVAASADYEARPSIAVDDTDRVWVAYEEDGPNWGKDTGMRWRGARGSLLYFQREIAVCAVQGSRVQRVEAKVPSQPIFRNYPDAETRRISLPRLAFDAGGRLWMLYRRHPDNTGGGEKWISFLTHATGDGWAEGIRLAGSENIMDNRPAVVPLSDGRLLLVHSTDARTRGTQTAQQNDLFCSIVRPGGPAALPELVDRPETREPVAPVHPNEPEDIRRIRDYRAEIGGKSYRLLRGEFHRHTELTSHRDQDGTLEEMWRYALDAAGMDWIGNGDHDNGYGVEYLWWLVQKQTDIYHHPPVFTPMFTYERSVSFPSGHRNAMFAYRGVRPLPRIPGGKEPLMGTATEGSPDIKTFYAYLKHFDGICASHTSGTNMGTDWRDNDPEVEPVVEIFQGLRHSYEHEGAPASAKGNEDAIGGYRPQGFVWNALKKGYRLGFEVSSDHYSTHISYAVVWAEAPTREAILDAFKRRHCYGANDNIILDVRCGEQMMGDEFAIKGKPTLAVHCIGTAPIARLSIIRGVDDQTPLYVYDAEPNQTQVRLTWTDHAPQWGKTAYYYVRVEQTPPADGYGALAWASPMWIDVRRD